MLYAANKYHVKVVLFRLLVTKIFYNAQTEN